MKTKSVVCALAIGAAACIVAVPASAQTAQSASVQEAVRHFQRAQAAGNAGRWDEALVEYDASNKASPSVAAQAGVADAHYQIHHDAEAADAYRKILALNVEVPPDQKPQWEAQQQLSRTRLKEIEERKNATVATPAAPTSKPAVAPTKPEKKRRKHVEEDDDPEEPVRTAKNALFAELAGNGLVYSINYERLFDDTGFGVRVGFSYISLGASGGSGANSASVKSTWVAFPILANYYVGSANHKLQLGVGVTLLYVSSEASSSDVFGSVTGLVPLPTANIGYRYMPARGGFNFSIGFTPFIIPGGETRSFLPWPGLGLGAVF